MKKLILLVIALFLSCVLAGQDNKLDTSKMSNYEKYYYTKNGELTVQPVVEAKKDIEYDDVYFSAKKDTLKKQSKELRKEKRELRNQEYEAYRNSPDFYEDFYYSSMIYRFYRPYHFPYYTYYFGYPYGLYNSFYYDPFFWDPYDWYWSYPYYNNYWYGYHSWYYNWNYPYYTYNNHRYGSGDIRYKNVPSLPRRQNYITSTTLNPRQNNRIEIRPKPQTKSLYSESKRTYTPSYTQPRATIRPQYNNSGSTQKQVTQQRTQTYNNYRPSIQPRSSAQTKTYTPSTRSSNSYSAPSRSSNSYSAPSRSSNSYSAPSRSYSAPSGSRSSGNSSYSSGSSKSIGSSSRR